MDLTIVALYTICDDLLISIGHQEHPQAKMSDAEVMTAALVAARYFGGNQQTACAVLKTLGYIPNMLGHSRFNRRLHRIPQLFQTLFEYLAEGAKAKNPNGIYIIDSFPIPVCDNIRISRSRVYQGEAWRGKIASKHRYFYGIKGNLMVTETGEIVEVFFTPGRWNDVQGLRSYRFDLPEGSKVYADKAYCSYGVEDALQEAGISLKPARKKNSKRQYPPWEVYLQQLTRKRVEVTISYLGEMTAKEISKFLGVSVNTITNRLWRARKRLREDQELLVQEVLGGAQFPTNLTENIMRQVADLKPTPPPVAKPLLPWGAFGVATLLVAMLLGATNQYLAHFQKPYSFEAVAEPTVEIVDTAILLDIDSKPDRRNQTGRSVSTHKNIGTGLQTTETPLVSDAQRNSLGPATLQWTRKADMPTARISFATSIVTGKVFVIGGNIQLKRDEFGDISASTVEMYDPKTDTWERKSDMPTARSGVSVSVVDGKIYAIGGSKIKTIQMPRGFSSESEELATVEMYDPVTDTWTQKADMPTPRKTMTCVVDDKIYAVGGWLTTNEQPQLGTVVIYDPATDTWTKARSMNRARCSAAIDVVNGEIYAIGGLGWSHIEDQVNLCLSSVEVFNPKTNQWRERTEMSAPKALHAASVIDGKIYVIGGYFTKNEEFKKLSTIEIYDPATDHWIQKPDMPIGKWGHKTEVIDGQIYIFGGGPVTSVQVYDPRAVP